MRTRFLNNDYFTQPPSQNHETFPFLHLPVPRLPTPPSSTVHHHLSFDSPLLAPSLHIDPLPIDAALSYFLAAVLPHRIHVDSLDLAVSNPDRDASSFAASIECRNRELEAEVIFGDHVSNVDIEFHEESKTAAPSDENEVVYVPIQFETPELDTLLENVCFTEKERMQMLSQTPEVENSAEMLNPETSRQYPYEALESVSRVEDPIPEYLKGDNAYSIEDNISIKHQPHPHRIGLIFEADEESLGIPTCLSMVEIVESYFGDIRPQTFDERYQYITESKELLGSVEHDMVKFFLDDCVSKKSLVLPDLFPEKDFINLLESEHVDGTSQAGSALLVNLVTFQEFVFLDEDFIHTFEAFYDTKASDDLEVCDQMFKKELNFKSFDELIVSNEIALIDDTFKSLPVPVISDCQMMVTVNDVIGELFSNMKTQPLSASNDIYLNWDLLEEDKCSYNVCNWYQNLLAKIDMNNQDFRENTVDDRKLVFDLVFCDDTMDKGDLKQSEELQNLLCDCISQLDNQPVEFGVRKILEHGSSNQGCQEQLPERSAERASLLFKSMSEISNFDYFLNPQKETVKGNHNFEVQSTNDNVNIPKVTSTELKAGLQLHGWHPVLHRIKLSDNIVALTRYFEKSYRAILQSDTELTRTHKSDVDYFELLSLQKHKLIEYHANGNNMAFVVLCAIKQAAWYLCFYGLNPACLYVDKLCQNSDYLKSRLGVLQSLIKDENRKMDNNITLAHPSLTMFKEILQSNAKQNSLKALIVAEEVFWRSLKNLLLSLGLSFSELSNSYRNQPYANNLPEDIDAKIKELLSSDCLLVSNKHVSPLFPFNKFETILEYGGPYGTSKISELSSNSVGLPHLHFLTVDLDDHAVLKALCNGVDIPPDTEMLLESETPLIFNHKGSTVNRKLESLLNFYPVEQSYDIKSSKAAPEADNFAPLISVTKTEHGHKSLEPSPGKLEQLLKFYPVEQSYDIKSSKAAHEADNFVPLIPAMKTEHGQKSLEPSLGSVIVVNTQNVDKEMIVSRRSSYQVILALEKEGIQVVERDLDLPVDIILSSSICLAWYTSRNLRKKSTPVTEASSSLPLCIENIATDVLTLLSFYFSGCFLVFEGEFNFLSTVMESSDGLYAAAASLGIDLQIFFSYSPELTNEVTISCIKSMAMLTRGLYPKMTDSVTLAESFLTQFPGINPLTAHSILSSGAMLNEFLAWSHEQRIHVLQKYHVPEESLSLLSVFCKYGEREDTKSIMTDCSSSVSSGPDSDRSCFYQADNKRKRKNPVIIDQKDELCFDDLLQFETLNQVVQDVPNSSTLPKPFDLGRSIDAGRSRDSAKASLYTNDFFCQNKRNIVTPMRNPSRVSPSSWNCNAPQILEQMEKPSLSLKNKELSRNEITGTALTGKKLNWHDLSGFEKLHDDVRGEVVDLTDSSLLDENFISDSMYFPNLMTETEKDQLRKNKIARKLSFDKSIHPATDSHSSRIWTSMQDTGGVVEDYGEPDFGKDVLPFDFKPRENVGSTQEAKIFLQGLHFQEGITHLSETPLSHARQSSGAFKHSPWTTEFINKVKEKSKLRQKSLLCGNISGPSKRRSPSIIDSFRYQPSRTLGNIPEQKRQKKQSGKSSNSVKKGRYPYPSDVPSFTPNDKRSTKTLMFGRSERGSQTKLVWSDKKRSPFQTL